jgi:hypothetical protein
MVTLQGSRCAVRMWQRSDASSLVRHADNFKVAKNLRDRFPHPYTTTDAKAFL